MAKEAAVLFVQESEPSGSNIHTDPSLANALWLKPSTGVMKVNGEEIPVPEHTHEQLGSIVSLLSNGITGEKTIGNYKFTFNHGILTGFEEA